MDNACDSAQMVCCLALHSFAVQNFSTVQRNTKCIFAADSRLWGPLGWHVDASIEDNIGQHVLPLLVLFVERGPALELDGFVIEFPKESYGDTLNALCRTTRRALATIWRYDPRRDPDRDWLDGIESPQWFYSFGGQRLFILATGPCYGRSSSRFAYGSRSTFLLLQPEHSFTRRQSPPSSGRIADSHRQLIRQQFSAVGQGYDLAITLGSCEAFRFVKPLALGDPPVRWWEVPEFSPSE